MLKWIIRIVLFILLIIYLNTLKTSIDAVIGHYEIYTNLPNFIIILTILLVPTILLIKFFKFIFSGWQQKYYYSVAIKFLNSFNLEEEKEFLVEILKINKKLKTLRTLHKVKLLINNGSYDKALATCRHLKVKASLNFIVFYYKALIYKAKHNQEEFILVCRQGVALNKNNAWFFEKLLEEALISKKKNDLLYLSKYINKIQFTKKEKQDQSFCLLNYNLAELMFNDNEVANALKLTNEVIKKFPKFTPSYKTLVRVHKYNGDNKKILDTLQSAWIENQNYDAIELWMDNYQAIDSTTSLKDLQKPLNHSKNQNMNLLLLAAIYIKLDNLLEAYEAINKVTSNDINKQLLEIALLKKEKNYNKIHNIFTNIFKDIETNWWSKFI